VPIQSECSEFFFVASLRACQKRKFLGLFLNEKLENARLVYVEEIREL
jgi:hypothetical protein